MEHHSLFLRLARVASTGTRPKGIKPALSGLQATLQCGSVKRLEPPALVEDCMSRCRERLLLRWACVYRPQAPSLPTSRVLQPARACRTLRQAWAAVDLMAAAG
jgi:hypothetical protein